jgi:hypothetical protein
MTIRDIMKYIESEYEIINSTPCEICGHDYITEYLGIDLIDGIPFDILQCTCEKCGHEKTFSFCAPFLDDEDLGDPKSIMN